MLPGLLRVFLPSLMMRIPRFPASSSVLVHTALSTKIPVTTFSKPTKPWRYGGRTWARKVTSCRDKLILKLSKLVISWRPPDTGESAARFGANRGRQPLVFLEPFEPAPQKTVSLDASASPAKRGNPPLNGAIHQKVSTNDNGYSWSIFVEYDWIRGEVIWTTKNHHRSSKNKNHYGWTENRGSYRFKHNESRKHQWEFVTQGLRKRSQWKMVARNSWSTCWLMLIISMDQSAYSSGWWPPLWTMIVNQPSRILGEKWLEPPASYD